MGSKEVELLEWNLAAVNYKNRELPTPQNNRYLRVAAENGMYDSASRVLDVGCGAGIYSVAFGKTCREVIGTDVSDEMIAGARENAYRYGAYNVTFHQIDWYGFELETMGWEGQFDLVFANMTPAVQSYHTLDLMNRASRKWCFLSKQVDRKNCLTYDLIKHAGLWESYRTFDVDMLCAFDALLLEGKHPCLAYDSDIWESEHLLPEACEYYIRRLEMRQRLSEAQKEAVREYLEGIAVDGKITDRTEVTIAMMYWRV